MPSVCPAMSGAARLLAALALLVALCAGRKVDSSIETQYPFPVLTDKFGFEEDSYLSISLDYTPPSVPLRFLMCSEADLTRLQYATITGLCMNASLIPCYLNAPMTGGAFRLNLTNIAPERYEFILANCEAAHIAVQIDMLFLNADGEHLSTHEQPLVYIRALSIGLWALLALAWLGHWALSDVRPPALHHVLSSVPLLKLLALAASLGSWLHLSAHGHVPDWLQVCNYLFTFLFNVAFYSAVLLVSRGWTITVLSVPGQELRAYGVTVLGLALSSLFYELLGRYYFFALLVMGVIYLRFALANVQTNIQELKHALRIIRQHPGTTLELLLRTKCTAMKRFNRLLVGYAFGMGGALVLVTFFFGSVTWVDSNKDWLVLLLLEAMLLLFFAGTAFLFRLRRIYPVQQPGAPVPLKNSAEDPAVVAVVPPYGRYTTLLAVREDAVGSLLG